MKRTMNLLLALGLMMGFATAQDRDKQAEVVADGPVLSFTERVFDFGEIDEGPKVEHRFEFKNEGTKPLVLSNVKASCGCTVPEWPKEPVLPGEEAAIDVTYTTKGRPGNFNKAITITSNATESTKIIYIKGKVIKAPEPVASPLQEQSDDEPQK